MRSDDRITRLEHLLGVRSVEDADLIDTISDEQLATLIAELEAYVERDVEIEPRRLKEIEVMMTALERARANEEWQPKAKSTIADRARPIQKTSLQLP